MYPNHPSYPSMRPIGQNIRIGFGDQPQSSNIGFGNQIQQPFPSFNPNLHEASFLHQSPYPQEPNYLHQPSYPHAPTYSHQSPYPQSSSFLEHPSYPQQPFYPKHELNNQNQPGFSSFTDSNHSVYPSFQPNYPNFANNIAHNNPVANNMTHNNFVANTNTFYEGTLKPFQPFQPHDDASRLYKAMKGFGTDETALIDVLCKRTMAQRQQILLSFKTGYGKDLVQNLKSETSGNFQQVLESLMKTFSELEACDLHKAVAGFGTDEATVIEILCTKNNAEMIELKNTYKRLFNKNLESDISSDVSGYFKRLLVSLITAYRSDEPANHEKAVRQAKELYNAGAGRLGTDEVTFNRIFTVESYSHLRLVFDQYQKLTGKSIESAIKSEMSSSVEKAFLTIAEFARNPAFYFAGKLYETMHGLGTNDRALIRNVILRSEKDMMQIKMEFQKRFGKTLESFIRGDCSGDYKRSLLCLIGDPKWR